MARGIKIPIVERRVGEAPIPGARQQISAPGAAFGMPIAAGLQEFGQQVSGAIQKEIDKQDTAVIMDFYNKVERARIEHEAGFRNKRGKDALESQISAQDDFEKTLDAFTGELSNDRQRAKGAEIRTRASLGFRKSSISHVSQEGDRLYALNYAGLKETTTQKAAIASADNRMDEVDMAHQELANGIDAFIDQMGLDGPAAEAERLASTTRFHVGVIGPMIEGDHDVTARKYLSDHQDEIDERTAAKLREQIDSANIRGRSRELEREISTAATLDPFTYDLAEAYRAAKEAPETQNNAELFDATIQRINNAYSLSNSARQANDSPRIATYTSLLANGARRVDKNRREWDELSTQGRAAVEKMYAAERRSRSNLQNETDRIYKLTFQQMTPWAQRNINLDEWAAGASRLAREELRLIQSRTEQDNGIRSDSFNALVNDMANDMGLVGKPTSKQGKRRTRFIGEMKYRWGSWISQPENQGLWPKQEDIIKWRDELAVLGEKKGWIDREKYLFELEPGETFAAYPLEQQPFSVADPSITETIEPKIEPWPKQTRWPNAPQTVDRISKIPPDIMSLIENKWVASGEDINDLNDLTRITIYNSMQNQLR